MIHTRASHNLRCPAAMASSHVPALDQTCHLSSLQALVTIVITQASRLRMYSLMQGLLSSQQTSSLANPILLHLLQVAGLLSRTQCQPIHKDHLVKAPRHSIRWVYRHRRTSTIVLLCDSVQCPASESERCALSFQLPNHDRWPRPHRQIDMITENAPMLRLN
jgi:hypothetical protein